MTSPESETPPATPPIGAETPAAASGRREFLKATACAALGGCALLAPVGAAVVVLANPLRAKGAPLPVQITTLSALPVNGAPRFFQVVTERRDAWTKFPAQAIGSIFLQRTGEAEVVAFNASCPHLGCAVEYRPGIKAFFCPCHNSAFAVTGEVEGPSPSRRGLDTLPVEIRGGGEVWIYFQNFKAGIARKIPAA
jgi:Rieske Fe-S protein